MTLLDSYKSQVEYIQESPKFKLEPGGEWVPVPFPGYSVITPPWEEEVDNATFYTSLQECQQKLLKQLEEGILVPVPPSSFHLTFADLIWDAAFKDATKNPDFEGQLRSCIADSFAACQSILTGGHTVRWIVLGLMLRTRAIGVCLAPADENSYKEIFELRRSIYQNSDLMALGIEQQYHFTAHITLGYFGAVGPELNRDRLCTLLSELNDPWLEQPKELVVRKVELRKFDDMMHYYREPDWPILEF